MHPQNERDKNWSMRDIYCGLIHFNVIMFFNWYGSVHLLLVLTTLKYFIYFFSQKVKSADIEAMCIKGREAWFDDI